MAKRRKKTPEELALEVELNRLYSYLGYAGITPEQAARTRARIDEIQKGSKTTSGSRSHSRMRSNEEESYASVHRKASREALRLELNRALAKIWDATHAADYHGKIYAIGTEAEVRAYADGLRGVKVRPITVKEQHKAALAKRQAYGGI